MKLLVCFVIIFFFLVELERLLDFLSLVRSGNFKEGGFVGFVRVELR